MSSVAGQLVVRQSTVLSARVNAAAQRINALSRAATLEFALEIGRAVIETLYDGRVGGWRGRAPKETGLRQLAAHPALCISASTLYRSLAVFELCERLNCADSLRHLGISHLRAVLSAPESEQASLVTAAETEGWSVAQLERAVSERSRPTQHRGGRPRSPAYVRSIRRMGELMNAQALEGLDEVDRLDPSQARELLRLVGKVRERISLIEQVLVRPARERAS